VGERGLKLSGGKSSAWHRPHPGEEPADPAVRRSDQRARHPHRAGHPRHLARCGANRTTLSIAHRLSTIADSDTILVLEQGRLVEQGNHIDLLRRAGLYAEMWARQAAESEELGEAAE
jgi:ATP-binding cassette subfamily B protein